MREDCLPHGFEAFFQVVAFVTHFFEIVQKPLFRFAEFFVFFFQIMKAYGDWVGAQDTLRPHKRFQLRNELIPKQFKSCFVVAFFSERLRLKTEPPSRSHNAPLPREGAAHFGLDSWGA